MKTPYSYQNIRLKDFKWLVKSYKKWGDKQLQIRETLPNPFELPDDYPNYYQEYFQEIKRKYKDIEEWTKKPYLGKFIKAKTRYKLNIQEYALLYGYTAYHISDHINSPLRDNEIKNIKNYFYDIWLFKVLLNKVLNKLPSYNNKTVYHDMQYLTEEEIVLKRKEFQVLIGKTITFNYFLSTHKDDTRLSDSIYIEIRTKRLKSRGKDISELSFVDNEREVLFKTNSKFFINGYENPQKKLILTEM
jgi:hypothetical protein